ncbi:hypothetical protein TrRE_jg3439 [Triparma retinervis]|uniref:START domain-containing protein n=1 Tax=Triparma retinervis TaxID=2557542 RepID=A0A9W6ZEF7_9STRA|nr:hypothetical protein TrRE_jg3439 [Triparma retinervis]
MAPTASSGGSNILNGFQTSNTTIKLDARLELVSSRETVPLAGDLLCPVVIQTSENGASLLAEGNTLLHSPQESVIDYIFKEMTNDQDTLKKMRLKKRENITKVLFQEFLPDYNRALGADPETINFIPINSVYGQIELCDGDLPGTSGCRMIFKASTTSSNVSVKDIQALSIDAHTTQGVKTLPSNKMLDDENSIRSTRSTHQRTSDMRNSIRNSMKQLTGISQNPSNSTKLASDTLKVLFRLLFQLFIRFDRSEEVDKISRELTMERIRATPIPPDCPEEKFAIEPLKALMESKTWTRDAGSANRTLDMYTAKSNSGCWLKRSGRFDTSCEEAFAHFYNMDSYVRQKTHLRKNPMLPYIVQSLENSRGKELTFGTKIQGGGASRLFENWVTWTKEDAGEGEVKKTIERIGPKMFIAMNPLGTYNEFKKSNAKEDEISNPENAKGRRVTTRKYDKFVSFPESIGRVGEKEAEGDSTGKSTGGESDGMVEGSLKCLIMIEPLAPRVCKVTYMLNVNLGSSTSNLVAAKNGQYLIESLRSMKTFFERNSQEVDKEVAEEMALKMANERHPIFRSIVRHTEEQTALIDRAYELQSKMSIPELWTCILPYELLKTRMKDPTAELRIMDRSRDNPTTCARVKGSVHCRADVAAASFFDADSHFRKVMHLEAAGVDSSSNITMSTTKLVKKNSATDQVVASLISFPNPMWQRQTIHRQVLGIGADGEYFIAMESVGGGKGDGGEGVADFGLTVIQKSKISNVKGRALLVFEPDPNFSDRCTFTWLLDYDLRFGKRSNLFSSDAEVVPLMIGEFFCLRDFFRRTREVDLEDIDLFAEQLRKNVKAEHTRKEKKIITSVLKSFQRGLQSVGGFKEFAHGGDPKLHLETCMLENDKNVIGKATCTVDANIFQCAAWELNKNREEATRSSFNKTTMRREFLDDGPHSFIYYIVYRFGKFIHKRDALMHCAWRCERKDAEDDLGTILLCYADNEEFERVGMGANKKVGAYEGSDCIRAETWTLWKFESISGGKQTKVTRVTQGNMKGFVPSAVMNRQVKKHMLFQSRLRTIFDKSEVNDANKRALTKEMMKNVTNKSYTEDEAALVKSSIDMFKVFHNNRDKDHHLDARLPGLTCSGTIYRKKGGSGVMGHNEFTHFWSLLFGRVGNDDSKFQTVAWGESTAVVRAGLEDLLAYIWNADDFSNSYGMKDMEKRVVKSKSVCHQVIYERRSMPGPLSPRDFLTSRIWKRISNDEYIVVSHPCTDPAANGEVKRLHGVVRASMHSILKLKRVDGSRTKLDMLVNPDLGGRIRLYYVNTVMRGYLSYVRQAMRYFLELRGLEEYDEEDGTCIASELMGAMEAIQAGGRGKGKSVVEELKMFKGLREVESLYPNFLIIFSKVCKNQVKFFQDKVLCRLNNMRPGSAERIGGSLSFSLATCLLVEQGVSDWISKYSATREADASLVWFRPMLTCVADSVVQGVSWGLKARVLAGACLEMLGLWANVAMAYGYLEQGGGYGGCGWGAAALLVVTGCAQAGMAMRATYARTEGEMSTRDTVREVVGTVCCLKPLVEAWNLIGVVGMEGKREMVEEILVNKLVSTCVLFIPLCVIHSYVLLSPSLPPPPSLPPSLLPLSALSSCLSFSYNAAFASYYIDTLPRTRKLDPRFTGFVPRGAGRRLGCFGAMVVMGMSWGAARSLALGALLSAGPRWLVPATAAGDLLWYLAAKWGRGDGRVSGIWGNWAWDLGGRAAEKYLCDFTQMQTLRHPRFMGGGIWGVNAVVGVGFVAGGWAAMKAEDGDGSWRMGGEGGLGIMGFGGLLVGILGVWLVSSVVFYWRIVEDVHRNYFFSWMTSSDFHATQFKLGDEEVKAFSTFMVREELWEDIREDVMAWVQKGSALPWEAMVDGRSTTNSALTFSRIPDTSEAGSRDA